MITLRPYRITDAEPFYHIMQSKKFLYWGVGPKSVAEERKIIRKLQRNRKKKLEYCYTIVYKKKIVGGCGIKTYGPPHIGELGYFVDEHYWNKGIATAAVKELEKLAKKIGVKRAEIRVVPKNKASAKVAKKCGYEKEGRLQAAIQLGKKYVAADVYGKVL
ncbi:MAG: GNAT family N-acetyltransferase [Candidatus Woesearchaeota archaeon]|nr:GNAT family N-acetyltransferase [Candidatus Woesearchaeota archaeon]